VAKPHERVFALVFAVLFLATSVAAGAGVIWQISQDNKQTKAAQGDTKEGESPQSTPQEGTLQGTKLANFTPTEKVDALQVADTKVGDGEEVKAGATVTAHYTGALAKDGTIFQSSHDAGDPVEFPLTGVIPGWTEGVPGMRVGGTRRLVIPAAKAYGENSPSPTIPANSDLVFDIEITAVKNP
jgi:FKBP-type peptidyl-prolyl cis-trans isomerase